ncbi:MAG TPA: response regulator [Saliniramus sp.]|nr:response regulator [Saliniramus sp.]
MTTTVANPRTSESTRQGPLRVLIADESAGARLNLTIALRSFDPSIEIVEVENGSDAAEKIVALKPDVTFVNVKLPGMSGAEAVAIARLQNVKPVTILMSDTVLNRWVALSTELDAYEFLKKPFDPEHVVAMMRAVTRMKQKLRLLLVEDSQVARALIRKVLTNARFDLEVDETDSGRHALKLMQLTKYDLALIDLNLAGIDGFETACQAKDISPQTTLLLMSGTRNEKIEGASKHFGVAGFLQKPFYAHHVEDVLHDIFGLRRPYLLNVIGRVHSRATRKKSSAGVR